MQQQGTELADFDGYHWSLASSVGEDELQLIREHMDRIERFRSELAPDERTWFRIPEEGSPRLFVKLFRHDSLLQRSRYSLFGSQAQTEWKYLLRLHDRNVPVPLPVALGQSFSSGMLETCILVTRNLRGQTLRDLLANQYGTDDWHRLRTHVWEALADVTARLIDAGFHHRDYHDQNIIVTPQSMEDQLGEISLHVTDLHRASISVDLDTREISSMVAFLLYSLRTTVPHWECRRFFGHLRQTQVMQDRGPDWGHVVEDLQERRREHVRSRSKSCFRKNENVAIDTLDDTWTVHHAPSVSLDRIRSWIQKEKGHDSDRVTVLKDRSDGWVYRIDRDDVVVEETIGSLFRRKCERLIGRSKSRRAWKNTYGLRVRDVPVPRGIALVEPRNSFSHRSSYLIRDFAPGQRVDDLLQELMDPEDQASSGHRSSLINALVRFVSRLHRKGVFHKDMKSNNILITSSSPPWRIQLIDLDRVDFYDRPLPEKPRLKNLIQLHASLVEVLTDDELKLAWKRYLNDPTIPFDDTQRIRTEISERSRERRS